jgi:hypothetical protein
MGVAAYGVRRAGRLHEFLSIRPGEDKLKLGRMLGLLDSLNSYILWLEPGVQAGKQRWQLFFRRIFPCLLFANKKKEVPGFPDLHCHDKLRDEHRTGIVYLFLAFDNNLIILFGMVDDGSAEIYLHVRCSFT